jgi:ubiquinone/menaquinone biosynthesis C-methylase UbiE
MGLFERTRLARWRRSMVRPASGLVLEIGAGTGLDFGYYVSGTTVIASDPDVGMLERARQKAGTAAATVLLVAADAEALPFRRGTFDTGVGGLVLCTIPHPGRALAEVRRVLKRGASLRLLEHVRMPNHVLARIQDTLTPIWMRIAHGCRLDRDAVEAVSGAGFTLESVVPHSGGFVVEIVGRPRRDECSPLTPEELSNEPVVSSEMRRPSPSPSVRG